MGWFDKLRKKATTSTQYADVLNGYTPIFTQFGQNIYASDVVQQAISCIVFELKKLVPTHIRRNGSDVVSVGGNVQSILNKPNEFMTTTDFIEKITWNLMLNYNSFIVPTYYTYTDAQGNVKRQYTGLYPVQPTQVDFIQDASGALFVKFRFANNFETTLPYGDVIHIRYRYSVNDYMGGGVNGQPDNGALLATLELNHTLLQGVAKAMKASFAINAVVKYKTMIDRGTIDKNIKEMEEKLSKGESGLLGLDLQSEFIPLQRDIHLVDADTLKFIDEKILRTFGVPLAILTGDYTKAQYEAFYQKSLEPIITSLSQAFTRTIFTDRERGFGNEVAFYAKDLIFMSVDQKLEMVNLLAPTGALYENEKRTAFGMKPLPELEGKRYMSLNWIDANEANKYQVGTDGETERGEE